MRTDALSATFAALADPTRRAILATLISGERSVTALAEPFDMSLPAVSKHLRVLERAGLIARSREAQSRPCRIEARPLKEVADWAERYRHIWEARLDRLDDYLRTLTTTPRSTRTPASEPRERAARTARGSGVPASERAGGSAGAKPPGFIKETRHARHPRRRQ